MLHLIAEDLRGRWLGDAVRSTVTDAESYLAKWAAFEEFASRSRRVLVVDDDDVFRASMRALLATGPRLEIVGEAADGEAAVRLAAELEPDLVLLDVDMPILDGVSAARLIRSARPQTRVVVVSGSSEASRADEACAAGADAYVRKGDVDRLLALVDNP